MAFNMYASLLFAGFIAALSIAPVAPEAGNILFLVVGGIGLVSMRKDALPLIGRPIVWMPLAAIVLVGTAYLFSAGVEGLVGVLIFAPLLCVWPLVNAARKAEVVGGLSLIGILALCGVAGAGFIAIEEVLLTGTPRAGGSIANPIHFADVALIVGFIGMLGLFFNGGRWRLIFLAAPLMAVAAVVLSGTRGAVVAAIVMFLTMIIASVITRLVSRRALAIGSAFLVLSAVAAISLGAGTLSGVERVMADISGTLATGAPTDSSTGLRLQMYLGGFRAFLASPLVGNGPLVFASLAGNLADVPFEGAPHLHNDIVDMAASAGIFGLIAYFFLIAAPIIEVVRSSPASNKSAKLVIIITLVVGYFVMGLTNAMFGILTVTTLFAAVCVLAGVLSDLRLSAEKVDAASS